MDRDTAVKKARKYLSLARNNNSDHEAALASEHLKKLMREHNLSESDLMNILPSEVGEWDAPGVFNDAWRLSILTFVSHLYGCRAIRIQEMEEEAKNLIKEVWYGKVIGRHSDANAAIYVFRYYDSMVLEQCRKEGYNLASPEDEDSFMRGIAYGIYKRVDAQTRNLPTKVVPLPVTTKVVVRTEKQNEGATRKFLDTKYAVRQKNTSTGQASNYDVFHLGYRASQNIRLINPDISAVAGLIEKADVSRQEREKKVKKKSEKEKEV